MLLPVATNFHPTRRFTDFNMELQKVCVYLFLCCVGITCVTVEGQLLVRLKRQSYGGNVGKNQAYGYGNSQSGVNQGTTGYGYRTNSNQGTNSYINKYSNQGRMSSYNSGNQGGTNNYRSGYQGGTNRYSAGNQGGTNRYSTGNQGGTNSYSAGNQIGTNSYINRSGNPVGTTNYGNQGNSGGYGSSQSGGSLAGNTQIVYGVSEKTMGNAYVAEAVGVGYTQGAGGGTAYTAVGYLGYGVRGR